MADRYLRRTVVLQPVYPVPPRTVVDKVSVTQKNWFKACKKIDQFRKSVHKDRTDDLVSEGGTEAQRLATAEEAQTFFESTELSATHSAAALFALCTQGCSRAQALTLLTDPISLADDEHFKDAEDYDEHFEVQDSAWDVDVMPCDEDKEVKAHEPKDEKNVEAMERIMSCLLPCEGDEAEPDGGGITSEPALWPEASQAAWPHVTQVGALEQIDKDTEDDLGHVRSDMREKGQRDQKAQPSAH